MTKRERQIFELIKSNPKISQNEISEKLNITRTSVAVHITHIMQKGYITGRQYIIKKDPEILVIGACNIDIQGTTVSELKLRDSNIGHIQLGYGGVGRNIAVNLSKLFDKINFITVLDKGMYGNNILDDLKDHNIGIKDIIRTDGTMSIYLSILDDSHEMLAGISDMEIVKNLSPEFLATKLDIIKKAETIVIDANLPVESIEYLASIKEENQKFIVDTVSIKKATKFANILDKIDILKTNKLELEALCKKTFKNKKEIKLAITELIEKGVKNVFLTLGSEGLIAMNEKKRIKLKNPKNINVVDVTGAGDVFTAALVFALKNDFNLEKSAKFAQCAAIIKVEHQGTLYEELSVSSIEKTMYKYYKENLFKEDEK